MNFKSNNKVVWWAHPHHKMPKPYYRARFIQYLYLKKEVCVIEIEDPIHARTVEIQDLMLLKDPESILKEIL